MSAGAAAWSPARPHSARAAIPVLVLGTVLLLALFREEARAAFGVWSSSSAFGHCFLVPPIALWLAWERRAELQAVAIRPSPRFALAAIPISLAWLVAERLGIMEGRQLVAMAGFEILVAAAIGWRLWRAFSVPLLYLFFLVPFGAFLVPWLQVFTAHFIDLGLSLLAIPHVVDAFIIEIPSGMFRVAEACAGLRFLIAAVAFGVLYACTMYRGPWRRLAFIAASVLLPMLANGLRALGIVVLGHVLGSPEAAAIDHVLYGWAFFTIVIVLLILAGLPFRDDQPPAAPDPTNAGMAWQGVGPGRMLQAVACVLAFAAIGPATAGWLDWRARADAVAMPPGVAEDLRAGFTATPGCAAQGPANFRCGPIDIEVSAAAFPPHTGPATLVAAERALTGELVAEDSHVESLRLPPGRPGPWRLAETINPGRVTATLSWIDGAPSSAGIAARLRQARVSLLGGAPPVLLAASAASNGQPDQLAEARESLRLFLGGQERLAERLGAASRAAPR